MRPRLICLVLGAPLAMAAEPSSLQIRDSVTRAAGILQQSQKTWFHKQSCSSCHQQYLPAGAIQLALQHGIKIDEAIAREQMAKMFAPLADLDRAVQYTHQIDAAMADGYALVAARSVGLQPSITTAVYARLLASRQLADGHWQTFDERPPQSYSPVTATAIAIQAIQSYTHPSLQADTKARADRARAWLLARKARDTEERVFQLLGVCWTGGSPEDLKRLAAELGATQQSDGGWNSLDGRASDAYSTGQALMALAEVWREAVRDPQWQRGIEWLLKNQSKDGSWHVHSRLHPPAPVSPPYFETGFPYGHDQFISSMGTSLAIVALSRAMGAAPPVNPAPIPEAEPKNVEPWVETLLFGSVDDVRKLLDGGFDPNAATKSGGTTALMLAAPDVAKMKLLLERGADINRRSKTRYSALLVATQYGNSSDAIRFLLDHGAELRLPKGQGSPLFGAHAMFLAALSGNVDVLPRLKEAGEPVNGKVNLAGFATITPALAVASMERPDVMRALLDAGAPVDEPTPEGITPLGWAVLANRIEMARLLIARGADVNHVDSLGMTPLLYAASIDFGDSAMIELLLKSGAKKTARSKDGLTALALAQKYQHTHLVAALK